jgi:predicted GNAT superfamily acetyltransferase
VPLLRPLADHDVADVLALNQRNVEALAPMDEDRMRLLEKWSDRFDVLEHDGRFAGFVITFAPGSPYDSENYRWFAERHTSGFYYLDRIVLHEDFRRRGLGGFVYDEMETVAKQNGRLVLEVNIEPPNDPSLAFHAGRGFTEVGRYDAGHKVVAMMEKPTP